MACASRAVCHGRHGLGSKQTFPVGCRRARVARSDKISAVCSHAGAHRTWFRSSLPCGPHRAGAVAGLSWRRRRYSRASSVSLPRPTRTSPLFEQKWRLPPVPANAAGAAALDASFIVGEGDYQVDWLLRDKNERVCSAFWKISARVPIKDGQLVAGLRPGAVAGSGWRILRRPGGGQKRPCAAAVRDGSPERGS